MVLCFVASNAGADIRPLRLFRAMGRDARSRLRRCAPGLIKKRQNKKTSEKPHASPQTAVRLRSRPYRASLSQGEHGPNRRKAPARPNGRRAAWRG